MTSVRHPSPLARRARSLATRLLLAAALTAGAGAAAGYAQGTDARAAALIRQIAEAEARQGAGQHTLSVVERRAPYEAGESRDAMRRRLEKETPVTAEGTFVYTPRGWLKDLRIGGMPGSPPSRARTAQSGETLRFVVEAISEGKPQTRALLSRVAGTAPGDAVLSRGAAAVLQGVRWESVKETGGTLTLIGTRTMERHTLTLRQEPAPHISTWELARTVPIGEKPVEQSYTSEVEVDPDTGALRRVREWVVNPLAGASVAYRESTVQKTELLAGNPEEALSLPLPRGTLVADGRTGVPVEYELLDTLPDHSPPPLTTKKDQPAPTFNLTGIDKKRYTPESFRKKALVLVWFSADSEPSVTSAEALDAFQEEYGKKGVQFLGIEVGSGENAAEAAARLRKESGWSFPVARDPGATLLPQFGLPAAIPAVAVVSSDGKLVYGRAGIEPTTLAAALDAVLQKGKD